MHSHLYTFIHVWNFLLFSLFMLGSNLPFYNISESHAFTYILKAQHSSVHPPNAYRQKLPYLIFTNNKAVLELGFVLFCPPPTPRKSSVYHIPHVVYFLSLNDFFCYIYCLGICSTINTILEYNCYIAIFPFRFVNNYFIYLDAPMHMLKLLGSSDELTPD